MAVVQIVMSGATSSRSGQSDAFSLYGMPILVLYSNCYYLILSSDNLVYKLIYYLSMLNIYLKLQYGLPMPIALLRADNNLPLCRLGLKEVAFFEHICLFIFVIWSSCSSICNFCFFKL